MWDWWDGRMPPWSRLEVGCGVASYSGVARLQPFQHRDCAPPHNPA